MASYFEALDDLRERLSARELRMIRFANWTGAAWQLVDTLPQRGSLGLVMGPRKKLRELIQKNCRLLEHCIFAFTD